MDKERVRHFERARELELLAQSRSPRKQPSPLDDVITPDQEQLLLGFDQQSEKVRELTAELGAAKQRHQEEVSLLRDEMTKEIANAAQEAQQHMWPMIEEAENARLELQQMLDEEVHQRQQKDDKEMSETETARIEVTQFKRKALEEQMKRESMELSMDGLRQRVEDLEDEKLQGFQDPELERSQESEMLEIAKMEEERLVAQLKRLQTDHKQLQREFEELGAQNSGLEEQRCRTDSMLSEKSDMLSQLQQLQAGDASTLDSWVAKAGRLEEEAAVAELERERLQAALADKAQQMEQLQLNCTDLELQCADKQSQLDTADREEEELMAKVSVLEQKEGAASTQIEVLKKEISSLQAQVTASKAAVGDRAELQNLLHDTMQSKESTEVELRHLEKQLSATEKQLGLVTEESAVKDEQIQQLVDKVLELQGTLDAQQATDSQAKEPDPSKDEQKELEVASAEVARLQAKVLELEREQAEMDALRVLIQEKDDKVQSLSKQLKAEGVKRDSLVLCLEQEADRKLSELQDENGRWAQKLHQAQDKLDEREEEINQLKQQQSAVANALLLESQSKLGAVVEDCQAKDLRIQELVSRCAEITEQGEAACQEAERLSTRVRSLEEEGAEVSREMELLTKEVMGKEAIIRGMEARAEGTRQDLMSQLEDKCKELEGTKAALKSCQDELEETQGRERAATEVADELGDLLEGTDI
eukprot:TRINITY_DN27632_c0_g2_i2.p1 TRINITY_DN27632_c0_g2~~TRINITY_DN27632_c0_g2_i2.p1  ORF type:complete len:706 (-),score=285.21 TRINITY_DN27632_c0_g2_i2:291-2408(-)